MGSSLAPLARAVSGDESGQRQLARDRVVKEPAEHSCSEQNTSHSTTPAKTEEIQIAPHDSDTTSSLFRAGSAGKGKGKASPPPPPLYRKGHGKTRCKPGKVHLIVQKGFAGEELRFEVCLHDFISEIKEMIYSQYGIPPLCQKLFAKEGVASGTVMENELRLRKFCMENDHVFQVFRVQLVISDSDVHLFGKSDSTTARIQAVEAFMFLMNNGSSDAFQFVVPFLEDPDRGVQQEAVYVLFELANQTNHERAIQELGKLPLETFWFFGAAQVALAHQLKEGNDSVWMAVKSFLADPNMDTIRKAFLTLALAYFCFDDTHSCSYLRTNLQNRDAGMRSAALKCSVRQYLDFCAPAGAIDLKCADPRIFSFILPCLSDDSEAVRRVAVWGLLKCSPHGDEQVIAELLTKLTDQSDSVKDIAFAGLAKLAPRGDQAIITVLCKLVGVSGPPYAVRALAKLANRGDELAISAIMSRLQDQDWTARGAATAALVRLASPLDERLIPTLAVAARDPAVEVRTTAIHALAYVVQACDESIAILEQSSDSEAKELLPYVENQVCVDKGSARISRRAVAKGVWWSAVELAWDELPEVRAANAEVERRRTLNDEKDFEERLRCVKRLHGVEE